MRTTGSPSETVKSPAAIKDAVDSPSGPRYGRPSDRFRPPMALFSPELALLRYDLEHLKVFTPNSTYAEHAFNLIEQSANFFADESKREVAIWPVLGSLLVGKSEWQASIGGGSAKPDRIWLEGPFAYLIVEVKNEPGLEGDLFLQDLVVYGKILAQDKVVSQVHSIPFH